MNAFHSLVSRALSRTTRGSLRRATKRSSSAKRRRRFESLEAREVFSADFLSAMNLGGAGSDGIFDMTTDIAGNSYVTGYFSGTADFDKSRTHAGDADLLTARGSTDAFVAKFAADNSLLWVRRMGGDHDGGAAISDSGRGIEVDTAGNVYVAGQFQASADFGATTLLSAGSADGFVTKLDATGTIQWAKRWGTTSFDAGQAVGVDAANNVYTVSDRGGSHEILKFGPTGQQVWSKSITGTLSGIPDLAVNAQGSVYVVSTFKGTVDFDPSSKVKSVSSGQGFGAFALKLDTNGKFGWVTPFVGHTTGATWGSAWGNSVTLDGSGNVYVGGHYHNSVDFNPSSVTTTLDTAGGAYVAKLNSSGALAWAKGFLSDPASYVYGIDIDVAGNVYAVGSFTTSIDLNPSSAADVRSSTGQQDMFVVKLNSSGNYVWGETFGGTGTDVAFSVDVTSSGKVRLAGYFQDEVDFDPDYVGEQMLGASGAARDAFFLELGQS